MNYFCNKKLFYIVCFLSFFSLTFNSNVIAMDDDEEEYKNSNTQRYIRAVEGDEEELSPRSKFNEIISIDGLMNFWEEHKSSLKIDQSERKSIQGKLDRLVGNKKNRKEDEIFEEMRKILGAVIPEDEDD